MRRFAILFFAAAGITLTGCAAHGRYYVSAPPAVRVDARIASPGPNYVWIDGYWGPGPRGYVWVPGRWVRPPRARAVWVAPNWELRNGRYRHRPGRWR